MSNTRSDPRDSNNNSNSGNQKQKSPPKSKPQVAVGKRRHDPARTAANKARNIHRHLRRMERKAKRRLAWERRNHRQIAAKRETRIAKKLANQAAVE